MNYYYVLGTNSAAYATTNPTSTLNDGSAGDTSTGVTQNSSGSFVPSLMTLFIDNGGPSVPSAVSFTIRGTPAGIGSAGTWSLAGSNDTTTWTVLASGASTIANNNTFNTYTATGLTGSYRYYRLGFVIPAGSGGTCTGFCTDWRMTLGSGFNAGVAFFAFF